MAHSTGGNVRVVLRIRPFLDREVERGAKCIISVDKTSRHCKLLKPDSSDPKNTRLAGRKSIEERNFTFDAALWSVYNEDPHYADQTALYDCLGREFLDHNVNGYNTCIFAYGQTGSGKTYSMMGDKAQPGLIPTTCKNLFSQMENNTPGGSSFSVKVSYFEIYNEQIRDLLVHSPEAGNLRMRESPTDGPYVKDLSEFAVENYHEVLQYVKLGMKNRTTATTNMNVSSSRSHAVFTLELKQFYHDVLADQTSEKRARIRLVDLAGSERAESSGAIGARLREGSNINKSLTTLGRVIAALTQASEAGVRKKKQVIPYRDSTLTWLLKDSLGGNSKTAMIACLSPSDYEEGLSTLRYADQAKQIRTRAVVNEDLVSEASRDAEIMELQETIRSLQIGIERADNGIQDNQKQLAQVELLEVQNERLRKLMEQMRQISGWFCLYYNADSAECKIKALHGENEALRLHLKLAVDSIRNPLPDFDLKRRITLEKKTQESAVKDLNDEWSGLLASVKTFRVKLKDDHSRFEDAFVLRPRENC